MLILEKSEWIWFTLKVDDCDENSEGGNEVHHVGQVLSIERLFQRACFIAPSEQKVKETDNSSLKFGTTTGIDSGWRECFPDNILTNISGNEQGDSRANSVSLLEHLIKKNDNHASSDKLRD